MRLKQLRGLPVIDPTAARKIGNVIDYQVDPATGRLAALDISSVQNSDAQRVLAQRIRRVGSSAVILTARGGAVSPTAPDINERWLDGSTLVGLEVMGDDGNSIGRLVDATFDQDTLQIGDYRLGASLFDRLLGRRSRIQPAEVHACSRELMMVRTGHVKEEVSSSADDTAPMRDLHLPLKEADRPHSPAFDRVQDGQPVGGRRS